MSVGVVADNKEKQRKRERLTIEGTVQGVGFRPFVYRLAQELRLSGYVQNTPAGVVIEIEGPEASLAAFKQGLNQRKPDQALFLKLDSTPISREGGQDFVIRSSEESQQTTALMMPDLAVCSDCLREMNDPSDRRYRYPFINCTHCGPRFSIITALPYDRLNTTMQGFEMCPCCRSEYSDADNRRHHAQPIACPECGPQLELRSAEGKAIARRDNALFQASQAVRDGKILALKGLGGFHLVCDARNPHTVAKLRRRKARPVKPFAVMYPSMDKARADCIINPQEQTLLSSAQAPIVLLRKGEAVTVAENTAPENPNLGVMLPYTPLHHLLMAELGFPIVATSGNRADEPICIDEDDAVQNLKGIADVFLVHNRPITRRCDDSIIRLMRGRPTLLRRARGYAPLPIVVEPNFAKPVLAVGGHLKNTVALAVGDRVFLSPHIGDLNTPDACEAHRAAIDQLCHLYKAIPEYIACDLHPDYGSSRIAEKRGGDVITVQHHYAHALSCMAENRLSPPCLAVVWDGAGFGTDNTIWGGECLYINPDGFQRVLHFLPFPLPGGDAAALDPKRSALGMLYRLQGELSFSRDIGLPDNDIQLIKSALNSNFNCPMTSSAGRIFDAVAALTGICTANSFEGQAAMALEYAADTIEAEAYHFDIADGIVDWRPMLRGILEDIDSDEAAGLIAAKFHTTLTAMIVAAAHAIGEKTVLLTGGCFQNKLLLEGAANALKESGFTVYSQHQVPVNDGGLALGQVMAVMQKM